MINRKKRIAIVVLIIFIIICVLLFFNIINTILDINKNNDENEMTKYESKIINGELIEMLIQPNNDWSQLPLTKHFREKFNSKYGVLGDIKADKIELDPYEDGRFTFDDYSYILVTWGLKQTAYIYHIEEKKAVFDDFWITQTYEITDENGHQLDMMSKIDEKNFGVSFSKLAKGFEDEKSVGVTKKFKEKYPYFLSLFIHYSPLEYNFIDFVYEKSSWDKKEAYFEVDSKLECKKREYLVKFTLDKKGYLDTAEVELKNEISYEAPKGKNIIGRDIYSAVFYKNSNWDNLEITDSFKRKYNPKKGVFPDIEEIEFNIDRNPPFYIGSQDLDDGWQIIQRYLKDKHFHCYLRKIYRDNKGFIDDIVYKRLEYIDIDSKEAKELYLQSISNN